MKTTIIIAVIALTLVLQSVSAKYVHKHCHKDKDCKDVVCDNNLHNAYCHDHECHCHAEVECRRNRDCKHCGKNYSCDHGHCHGKACKHTRK